MDASGNVVIGDQGAGQVFRVNRSQVPSLAFATTNAGSTSLDSPKSVTLQNVGNQPLSGSLVLNLAGGFQESNAQDCSTQLPLAPGASCGETFSFTPQAANFFSGTAVFTDNNLNLSPGVQTITLTGTGATNGVPATVAVPNVIGQTQTAVSAPITAVGLAIGTVSTSSSQTVPAGTVISQNPPLPGRRSRLAQRSICWSPLACRSRRRQTRSRSTTTTSSPVTTSRRESHCAEPASVV